MEKLEEVIFYTLEKSIKSYRQFAQRNLDSGGVDITIDQWLILKLLSEHPEMTQSEIAVKVFKDAASVTRIIELLVNKKYIRRATHPEDRRKFLLTLSPAGKKIVAKAQVIVNDNRKKALQGISRVDLEQAKQTLLKIIAKCE